MRQWIKRVMVAVLVLGVAVGLMRPAASQAEGEPLLIGMEANYPPSNWTQDDDSNGAIPIQGSSQFANGFDVQIARMIGEHLGRPVEVVKTEWEGLIPAIQSGKIDLIIGGMAPTPERAEVINFSDPYYQSQYTLVMREDSPYAQGQDLDDFEGARVAGQIATSQLQFLEQLPGADVQPPMKNFAAMRVAVQSGKLDAYISDTNEAMSAIQAIEGLTYIQPNLPFEIPAGAGDTAVGVKKGNDELLAQVNEALSELTQEESQAMYEEAIASQPANAGN